MISCESYPLWTSFQTKPKDIFFQADEWAEIEKQEIDR